MAARAYRDESAGAPACIRQKEELAISLALPRSFAIAPNILERPWAGCNADVQLAVCPEGVSVKKSAAEDATFDIAVQGAIHLFVPELSVSQPDDLEDVVVGEP